MSGLLEETLAAVVAAQLAPVRGELDRLAAELNAVRRALPPTLVTIAEAAEVLGVSVSTVRRQVRDGRLPSRRVGRRSIRVDLSGLHATPDAEIARLADAARRGI